MIIKYYFYKQYKMWSLSGAGGAEDVKYNYIKIVGEESIAAAVLAPKCGPLSMPPKKVGDGTHKTTNLFERVKSMFYIYQCKIQNIILQ